MTWVWAGWLLALAATFAALEGYALHTGRKTLSRTIREAFEAWPMVGVLMGFLFGGLLVHFFWRFC